MHKEKIENKKRNCLGDAGGECNRKTPPTFSSFSEDCDLPDFFKPSNALIHFFGAPISVRLATRKFRNQFNRKSVVPLKSKIKFKENISSFSID